MTPYREQVEAVKIASSMGQGTISMCTGFGKSLVIALLIKEIGAKTLVVVPNLELKKQLIDSFTVWFGSLDNITIENIASPKLKNLKNYDCLIIDEAHHAAAKTYRKLNKTAWNNIYYRFFFTATPYRSNDSELLLMQSITGRVIYEVDYKKAVKNKQIVPVEAYYIELPKRPVEGYTWNEVYNELVVNNEHRNSIIANILSITDKSTLCLVKEITHGDNIKRQCFTAFANGFDEATRGYIKSFNDGKLTTLIATQGICGEGVDTKPAEYIILAGLGKAKNQFMQAVGRGLRTYKDKKSCKVIIFKDPSHKWTRAHFREQCKILLDMYGVIPVRLDL